MKRTDGDRCHGAQGVGRPRVYRAGHLGVISTASHVYSRCDVCVSTSNVSVNITHLLYYLRLRARAVRQEARACRFH